MKDLFSCFILLVSFSLFAQKEVSKEVKYESQSVKVEFPFASRVEIKTWDKSAIKVDASIKTDEEKYTEMFDVKVKSDDSSIRIESNSKEIFRVYQDEKEGLKLFHDGLEHEFDYVMYVPNNVKLKLNSITANVTSEFMQGDIEIEVVSGDIAIEKHKGDLKLKSVAGKIEAVCENTRLMAKTVVGEIHSDKNLKLERKDMFVGQEVNMETENAANSLSLTTVNGDIYLK